MGFNLLPHVVVGVLRTSSTVPAPYLALGSPPPGPGTPCGPRAWPGHGRGGCSALRLRLAALHVVEVVEALIPLGVGGGLRRAASPANSRQSESRSSSCSWPSLGGCSPRGDTPALAALEVLVLQLAQLAAIHSVGHRRARSPPRRNGRHPAQPLLVGVKPTAMRPWGAPGAGASTPRRT